MAALATYNSTMETESAEPRSTERLAVPTHDPSVMKLTRGHSCVLCQQRKVRCDKQKPCANCVKAQVECRVVPPQPPRRRKKKPHERDLIERLKKYEALMSQHGVAFDPIGHDFKPPDGTDDVTDLEQDLSGLKTSSGASTREYNSPGSQEAEKLVLPSLPTLPNPHFCCNISSFYLLCGQRSLTSNYLRPLKWFPYYKEVRTSGSLILSSLRTFFLSPRSSRDDDGPTRPGPSLVGRDCHRPSPVP